MLYTLAANSGFRAGELASLTPESFDLDEVVRRARSSDASTLGELLLEQRVCAGIGNIYKCEALWQLRLNPWSTTADLDDETLRHLYRTARDLMRRNLITPIHRQRHAVHARGRRPCPRCGAPIRIEAQGAQARLTYYCPRCQGSHPDPIRSGRTPESRRR